MYCTYVFFGVEKSIVNEILDLIFKEKIYSIILFSIFTIYMHTFYTKKKLLFLFKIKCGLFFLIWKWWWYECSAGGGCIQGGFSKIRTQILVGPHRIAFVQLIVCVIICWAKRSCMIMSSHYHYIQRKVTQLKMSSIKEVGKNWEIM